MPRSVGDCLDRKRRTGGDRFVPLPTLPDELERLPFSMDSERRVTDEWLQCGCSRASRGPTRRVYRRSPGRLVDTLEPTGVDSPLNTENKARYLRASATA